MRFFQAVLFAAIFFIEGCGDDEAVTTAVAPAPIKKSVQEEVQPSDSEIMDPVENDIPDASLPQYSYTGAAGRDPFVPFFSKKPIIPDSQHQGGEKEAPSRPKEALEQFDLSTLKLVAVIGRQGHRIALVRDISGRSYQVFVGNHVGINEGKVVRIGANELIILEPYVDQFGQQQERLITKSIKGN
ncbi:MAG: hypothetical protein COX57_13340 [Alphaproteobacteria bacterium CG_4_10_14_0_2_um_filter_63_37]|nr:MAG: hypothetical protein AUJ55_12645 [Proteobacteria bacterium CG1_02_64_396]PJA23469.1 MAG: hypothetical protein COX57_13340 [Alphaproteobacteria bacterium CG_4_10_14_0_2_um_filter_63_37]